MTVTELSTIVDVDLDLEVPCSLDYDQVCGGVAELHLRCACGCSTLSCARCWNAYAAYVAEAADATIAAGRTLILVFCTCCGGRTRVDLSIDVPAIDQIVTGVVPL